MNALYQLPQPHEANLPDVHSPATAAQVLAVFFRLSAEWGLTAAEEQTLLGVGRTTLFAWKAGRVRAGLEGHTLERLSYLLRIYAALEILLPVPERARAWLRRSNSAPLFGGGTALARMLGGQVGDLMVVAAYLDAQRGGDFA
ncbi:MAG: MbcA/ParS/Xre antitoxin family protein [Proteobacteria bacterium]|nr:MbcA/ParS/Xre antitoxin family protein [Pseudomonadota bacterium]